MLVSRTKGGLYIPAQSFRSSNSLQLWIRVVDLTWDAAVVQLTENIASTSVPDSLGPPHVYSSPFVKVHKSEQTSHFGCDLCLPPSRSCRERPEFGVRAAFAELS